MELDFDSAVEAWKKKDITRDQLAEYLKELGFNSALFTCTGKIFGQMTWGI